MLPDFNFSAHHAEEAAPRSGLICANDEEDVQDGAHVEETEIIQLRESSVTF